MRLSKDQIDNWRRLLVADYGFSPVDVQSASDETICRVRDIVQNEIGVYSKELKQKKMLGKKRRRGIVRVSDKRIPNV